jgi:hypothetical protein
MWISLPVILNKQKCEIKKGKEGEKEEMKQSERKKGNIYVIEKGRKESRTAETGRGIEGEDIKERDRRKNGGSKRPKDDDENRTKDNSCSDGSDYETAAVWDVKP